LTQISLAEDYTYESISKKYPEVQLYATAVQRAQMEGECLVGLKNLNFKKKDNFDAVAEWSSYRSFSLLEQFPPCKVLFIMEVAQARLKASGN
jgi:hypothetical protein